MSSSQSTTFDKTIAYDRETRDFAAYLDGELVAFCRTYGEAETTLNELVYSLLTKGRDAGDGDAAGVAIAVEPAQPAPGGAEAGRPCEVCGRPAGAGPACGPACAATLASWAGELDAERRALELHEAADGLAIQLAAVGRWERAVERALTELEAGAPHSYDPITRITTITSSSGATYEVNGQCHCPAAAHGQPCWHRAAAAIVGRVQRSRLAGAEVSHAA